MRKNHELKSWDLYTDGSCLKNPGGVGGWACVIIPPSHNMIKLSGYVPSTTNQQMELAAVIQGLRYIPEDVYVDVYSDSRYVCDGFNKNWIESWSNNGWINSKKEPVKNVELWKALKAASLHKHAKFHWVKGHASNPLNNECDRMAREVIDFNLKMKSLIKEI